MDNRIKPMEKFSSVKSKRVPKPTGPRVIPKQEVAVMEAKPIPVSSGSTTLGNNEKIETGIKENPIPNSMAQRVSDIKDVVSK